MKCGLIVMGDLPRWKKYDEVRSHCHGWPTRMEKMWYNKCVKEKKNRTYLAKFWRDDRRKGWKTWCFLIILDHRVWKLGVSWLQGLKTRGFPIARLIFSFLWDFPNGKVYPIFFLFHDQNWFFIIITTMLPCFSTISLNLIKGFPVTIQKYVQIFFFFFWG